ncbi:MAG TPA: aminotransferase class I/II-fold pyridoxal phosphate-dependent enzyme [Bacillota bacterium]|nr:aminotransferase class I/II-fold pyridoxal phosphate-dependent enzyme [Bacillota bacterium]
MSNVTSWEQRVSPVVRKMPPSGIRRFFDMVAEMKGVISLGVGEPDFVTPWSIRESCIFSLEKGKTMYTSNHGLLELREAIAQNIYEDSKVVYQPRDEIVITVGVSEGMDLAMRAILTPGDEVIIPEPCYVSYQACTLLAGGVPVSVVTKAENEFRLTPEQLEAAITPKTKAVILAYPSNPTGAIMTRADLEALAKVIEKHDLIVISDEIYDKLTYEGEHTCFASLPGMKDRTILLNGFSKAYAMTGWRIGYACGNKDFISAMVKIHQYTMLCAPITAQNAALEALKNGRAAMEDMVKQYDQRRKLILHGLRQIGLDCFEPKGAFYIFPSIAKTGLSEEDFAEELLKEAGVALVPGTAFGAAGKGHVRCSYASSVKNINEALERIGNFVAKRIG